MRQAESPPPSVQYVVFKDCATAFKKGVTISYIHRLQVSWNFWNTSTVTVPGSIAIIVPGT